MLLFLGICFQLEFDEYYAKEGGPPTLPIKVLRRNEVDAWDSYPQDNLNISKYCFFDIVSEFYNQPTNPARIAEFLRIHIIESMKFYTFIRFLRF